GRQCQYGVSILPAGWSTVSAMSVMGRMRRMGLMPAEMPSRGFATGKTKGHLGVLASWWLALSFLGCGRRGGALALFLLLTGFCEIVCAAPAVLTYQAKLTDNTGAPIT